MTTKTKHNYKETAKRFKNDLKETKTTTKKPEKDAT